MANEFIHTNVSVTHEQIAAFCEKWKVTKMELFGSVLRDDFDAASDIDVLVVFQPGAQVSIATLVQMEEELGRAFRRKVDVVDRRAIEESPNPIRRKRILSSVRLVYAAA